VLESRHLGAVKTSQHSNAFGSLWVATRYSNAIHGTASRADEEFEYLPL